MMVFIRIFFFLALYCIYGIGLTHAEETDQFTLPPTDLEDIGPIISTRLYHELEQIRVQTNAEIRLFSTRAPHSRHAANQLSARREGLYIANLFYKHSGPGIPRWIRLYQMPQHNLPIMYKERRPWNTVYWLVFSQSPLSLIGLAPTINLFGIDLGTDKLGHFFMQGHTYYSLYQFLLKHGKTPEKARSMMVTYGQILEQTYLGTLVNGVYSNGDLSGNYAGWKFYMNLTEPVRIGEKINPPILILKNNQWEFSKHIKPEYLLKPYISSNLNEAYNPCRYSFMRGQIRNQVKNAALNGYSAKAYLKRWPKNNLMKPSNGMENHMAIGFLHRLP